MKTNSKTRHTVLQTRWFRLYRIGQRHYLRCRLKKHHPSGCRVTESDVRYHQNCGTQPNGGHNPDGISTFDMACVWDYGVGVFQ